MTGRRWLLLALAAGLVAGTALWQDRGSVERGNRLYREGDTVRAAEVYRGRTGAPAGPAVVTYNLGTALLALDPEEAAEQLLRVAEGDDPAFVQSGRYNLGYRFLTSVDAATEPDSAIALLRDAVTHGRVAVRLDPGDEDARWNLALAQRMLDSLTFDPGRVEGETDAGDDETEVDDLSLTRSEMGVGESGVEPEESRVADNVGQRRGASEGARESWTMQDPGPLTEAESLGLLQAVDDPPERLIRGILWSLRPDVAWWASEASPGGSW